MYKNQVFVITCSILQSILNDEKTIENISKCAANTNFVLSVHQWNAEWKSMYATITKRLSVEVALLTLDKNENANFYHFSTFKSK